MSADTPPLPTPANGSADPGAPGANPPGAGGTPLPPGTAHTAAGANGSGTIFIHIEEEPLGSPEPTDIRFTPADDATVPTDVVELTLRVSRDIQVLRAATTGLALSKQVYRGYFDRILGASRACLGGSTPEPEVLRLTLAGLETQAVDELGPRLKNAYLVKHMRLCAKVAGALLLLAVFAASLPLWIPSRLVGLLPAHPQYFVLLLVGAVGGVSVSFAARNTTLSFAQLQNPEADFLQPDVRLAIVCVLTWALGLVFSLGMLNVTVGGLNSGRILAHAGTALLVGFLCGFSEQALPTAVVQRSNDFFRSQLERT